MNHLSAEEKKQYCLQMATVIHNSLFWSITPATFCSWGVSERIATWHDNKPSLEIKVQGMLHKGSVLVSYNEGVDVFEVRLLNPQRVVVKTLEQVFADELGTRIDELVERPAGMNDDEYRQKAWADSVGKMIAAQ